MNNLSGGYIMVDINSNRNVLLKQIEKAINLNKPCLVYDGNDADFMTVKRYHPSKHEHHDEYIEYMLYGVDTMYFVNNLGYVNKIPKNIEGSFNFEFSGNGYICAEIHDSYIKITVCFYYDDENLGVSKVFNSSDVLGTIKIPQIIKDRIQPVAYSLTGAYYDSSYEPVTDPFYVDVNLDDNPISIVFDDPLTINEDETLLLEGTIYLI